MKGRVRVPFVVTASIYGVVFIAALVLGAPQTVLTSQPQVTTIRRYVATLFPQSWPFFTRPPQSAQYGTYTLANGTAHSALITPQATASNAFGLTRRQRAQGPELAYVTLRVAAGQWKPCNGVLSTCLASVTTQSPQQIPAWNGPRTLCGDLIATTENTVTFNYRRFVADDREHNVSRAAHIQVAC